MQCKSTERHDAKQHRVEEQGIIGLGSWGGCKVSSGISGKPLITLSTKPKTQNPSAALPQLLQQTFASSARALKGTVATPASAESCLHAHRRAI